MYHVGHFRRGLLVFLTLCLIALNSGPINVQNAQARGQDVVARHLLQSAADVPTETMEPTETEVPTETMEPTETEVPTETMEPTETEVPTETMEPTETEVPTETMEPTETDVPTETMEPTESEVPTETMEPTDTAAETMEPTETSAPTTVPTEVPTTTDVPVAPAPPVPNPTPTTISYTFEVPNPTGGIYRTPEPDVVPMLSSSSRPGDTVIVNIAPYGKAVDWVLFDIPDPENGMPKFENDRQMAAFRVFLSTVPNVGGLYFTNPPTIRIETYRVVPTLMEQKPEPRMTRGNMSLGRLMASGSEDEGILIAQKVLIAVAIISVVVATGGVAGAAYLGPLDHAPDATIFLAAVSEEPVSGAAIFHCFIVPGEEWYLPPLPPGSYMMRLRTPEGEIYNFPFKLTGDPTESLLFQPDLDGVWKLSVEHNGGKVISLPSTGGGEIEEIQLLILGLGISALGAAAVAVRKQSWNRV